MKDIQPLFNLCAEHGESPVWDDKANVFYWVDLLQGSIHKAQLSEAAPQSFEIGQPIGVFALREGGGYIMALKDGFAFYEDRLHTITPIFDPEAHLPTTRFNDGGIDPLGRFFAGTMDFNGNKPIGSLYSINNELQVSQLEKSMFVANGMDWNPEGNSFFLTDTNRHTIYKYRYDIETGAINDRRDFIVFAENEFPDGMCIDAFGNLWIAMWNGSKISHFDPTGKKIEDIILPVQYPTSCCFGGDNLSTLLVTTSTLLLNEKEKKEQPLAGRVLSFDTAVKGQIMRKFKG